MKRTLSFMVMALALLLTQCRKPEVKFPTPSSAEGVTVSMTVTAGPGSKTDITDEGAITWSKGDKLYVGFDGKYVGCLELVGNGGFATGTFSGNVTLTGISDGTQQTFHFFYLGSTARTLTVGDGAVTVSFATQTGLLGNLGSCHIGYGTAQGTVAGSKVTGINVTLVSKVALARFSFKKGDAAYDGALTLSGDHIYSSMTVGFNGEFNHGATAGNITLTAGHSERYVMLVPVGTGSETLSFAGDGFAGSTTLGSGIESNKFYGRGEAIVVNLTKVPVPVTGVTVAPTELNLLVGETSTLTAAVTPENADDKSVTWSSSDPGVATVSDAGLVTAVAEGTATITVTATNGTEATDDDKTAKCEVTVTESPYVDLGLSVRWAKCNLGATSPGDYGDYYQWGGVTSSTTIDVGWANCPGNGGNSEYNATAFSEWRASNLDGDTLKPEVDAAHVVWGGDWRMPTEAEFAELISNTTHTWKAANATITIGGQTVSMPVAGYYCESNKSGFTGKYIFLPAAGNHQGSDFYQAGTNGYYWSSSLHSNSEYACRLMFHSGIFSMSGSVRCMGVTVRPVCPSQH